MIKVILRIGVFSIFFINYSFAQDGGQIQKNSESVSQSETETATNNDATLKETPKKDIVLSGVLNQIPQIASSINPIYQIAKFISGDNKSNFLLISPKVSEHNYQFKVSNINTLKKVGVFFYVGDGLENYFVKALASLEKQPKIVQLSKSKYVKLIHFQSRANENDTDYHIWLSPENAIAIAGEIAENLSTIYPPSALIYKKNLQQFILDIKKMDQENKVKLSKVKSKSFVIDHDSLAYFENYYNIKSAGVMRYYHRQDLTSKDIERINNLIKDNKISCIVGGAQERSNVVVQIASNNKAKLVLVDIMGDENNGAQNGYTKMMSNLVDNLVKCTNK
jgi:zinc transport system substrate-binding protein